MTAATTAPAASVAASAAAHTRTATPIGHFAAAVRLLDRHSVRDLVPGALRHRHDLLRRGRSEGHRRRCRVLLYTLPLLFLGGLALVDQLDDAERALLVLQHRLDRH